MPVTGSLTDQFRTALHRIAPDPSGRIVLAVSGGSDSTALMHLAAAHLPQHTLIAVSVDHGLRDEAKAEIAQVASQAQALGLSHRVAHWRWDGQGNLQAAARDGRWTCLRETAQELCATAVWTGHTADDQAETVLMRLSRGSGVDGLAAMAENTTRDGLAVARPLLAMSRQDLRDWLTDRGIGWSDDPSNEDPRYARVQARKMASALSELGLTRKRLLQTVDHMQAAQVTLQEAASRFASRHVTQDAGDLVADRAILALDAGDTPRRVLAAALGWVGGHRYRPRFAQLTAAASSVLDGRQTTLGGVVLSPEADGLRMTREAAATQPLAISPDTATLLWDGRWRISGPSQPGLTVRALGEGIADCPHWRDCGLPRLSLLASPAIWRDDTLIAAPLAGLSNGWSVQIVADFQIGPIGIED